MEWEVYLSTPVNPLNQDRDYGFSHPWESPNKECDNCQILFSIFADDMLAGADPRIPMGGTNPVVRGGSDFRESDGCFLAKMYTCDNEIKGALGVGVGG